MASADGSDEVNETDESQSLGIDLATLLARNLGFDTKPEQLLTSVSLDGVVEWVLSGKCHNIITMAGAGISTSAGIPDFRSPDTGLYSNLQKYNLPDPTAIFTLDFFMKDPKPFFTLAKELWPGSFTPTPCHFFIKLLDDKKLLLRHYTQNIDTLERVAGLHPDRIVEAHGTFHTSHCVDCKKEFTQEWIKARIFSDEVPLCDVCGAVVKPDIVFFGEALPQRFATLVFEDLKQCDLLIVMGTSLTVQPFSSLTSRVQVTCPRLYINREKTGSSDPFMALLMGGGGFEFDKEDNYRDVFLQGDCDSGCQLMAEKLGWKADLEKLISDFGKTSKSSTKDKTGSHPTTDVASSKVTKSPTKTTTPIKSLKATPPSTSGTNQTATSPKKSIISSPKKLNDSSKKSSDLSEKSSKTEASASGRK